MSRISGNRRTPNGHSLCLTCTTVKEFAQQTSGVGILRFDGENASQDTDRFTAAVSMRPVINWHSFVGNTDGASWYNQFQKFPWVDPMEFAVRSPLHYVANVKTPTMVMTGEADLRTPMTQSEEFYRALKMLKKETLLVRMPEEFHGWRRPSHQLLQQLYLMAWFEKHSRKDKPEAAVSTGSR